MKPEFIIHRDGGEYVLYAGLVDQAHQSGLVRVATTLLQAPDESLGCRAIVSAEVQTERGTFGGIGEAVMNEGAAPPVAWTIDAAELRAKAKALRDALNVHLETVEERFGPDFSHRPKTINEGSGHTPRDDQVAVPDRSAPRVLKEGSGPSEAGNQRARRPEHPTPTTESDCAPVTADMSPQTSTEKSVQRAQRDLPEQRYDRRATPNQVATIAKLCTLLGSPDETNPDLSAAEASMRIAELARLFNDRSPAPDPIARKK